MNMDGQDEQDFRVRRQSEAATALSLMVLGSLDWLLTGVENRKPVNW
tara:strand:+ start:2237 stop:2377 length:141 start_codon:yes stop_codon:yes gene_type:complete